MSRNLQFEGKSLRIEEGAVIYYKTEHSFTGKGRQSHRITYSIGLSFIKTTVTSIMVG